MFTWENAGLPLTPLQGDILVHALRQPQAGMYVEQLRCVLEGELDYAAFAEAWQQLVARHDALRTGFEWRHHAGPKQHVQAQASMPIDLMDWSDLSASAQEAELDALRTRERLKPFDLEQPPLMRASLARLGVARHALVWTYHHLILDGWSVGLLMADLIKIYVALADGSSPSLGPGCSYVPYIRWLARRDMGETLAYWRARLDGFNQPTIVARDRECEEAGAEAETLSALLSESDSRAIQELACTQGCAPFTIVAAAWAIVLASVTQARDVMFGATVSGRPCSLPTVESMIGLFINTIPFRVAVDPAESVPSWLRGMEDMKRTAVDRHSYASLAEVLKPLRHHSAAADRMPFNTLVVYENYPLPGFLEVSPGLKLHDIRCAERMNYDITLFVMPSAQMELTLSFDGARYTRLSMRRLISRMRGTLERLCRLNPATTAVNELLEPSDAERHRVLVEYARGRRAGDEAGGARIEQLVWARAEGESAHSIAVSCGQTQWTYGYLQEQARAIARQLAAIGIGPDDRIGLSVRRGPWLVAGALGIMEAGGCYVPIDIAWPAERREWIAEDAGLKAVLVDVDQAEVSWGPREIAVVALGATVTRVGERGLVHDAPPFVRSDRDLAYVIYTSGSTGKPKGVMVEHESVVNRLRWSQRVYPLATNDRVLQKTPATFDISVWELFGPLIAGARVVLAAPDGHRDPRYLARELRQRRIGTVHFVASMLNAFLQDPGADAAGGLRSRWLRNVVNGGEALPFELVRQFWDSVGGKNKRIRLFNFYGPTEATVEASGWECPRAAAPSSTGSWDPNTHGASVPIGRPIDGMQMYVLDSQLRPVPPGAIGELCIGGIGVARGYLGRPGLTARYFAPDPFATAAGLRLYCTGDLARWRPDGALDYLGRIDHQIKIRGVRVEPGEIEQTIVQHPLIESAVVVPFAKPDGGVQLAAYVARRDRNKGWEALNEELTRWLRARLPVHLVPAVVIDMPSGLPLNASGKLDRRALPPPVDVEVNPSSSHSGMQVSATEDVISELWADVLGLPSGRRIPPDADFFHIGGDSLSALKAAARMSACFGIDVPVATLWSTPTLHGVAGEIERRQDKASRPLPVRVDASGPLHLSSAQQRLWIVHQLNPSGIEHNVTCAVWLDGALNESALATALNHLVERHAVLRTEFFESAGVPLQRIRSDVTVSLAVKDVSGDAEAVCLGFAQEQSRIPFDLRHAPLIRATLLRRSRDAYALVLTLHHIACDGASAEILLRDLCAFYEALSAGRPAALTEPAIRYVDFAAWQNEMLKTAAAEADLAYWRRQLQDLPADHGLTATHQTPGLPSACWITRRLSADLTRQLRAMKQAHGVTMFMLVLAGFKALLHHLTGRIDIVVGADVSDRPLAESWNLAGFFINQLALRTNLDGDPAYASLIDRVRATCVAAYAHQSAPYERLVQELAPHNGGGRSFFQLKLVQQQPLQLSFQLGELTVRPMPIAEAGGEFDMILNLSEDSGALILNTEFRADRFASESVNRMLERLERILAVSCGNPALRLSELNATVSRDEQPLAALSARRRRLSELNRAGVGI